MILKTWYNLFSNIIQDYFLLKHKLLTFTSTNVTDTDHLGTNEIEFVPIKPKEKLIDT